MLQPLQVTGEFSYAIADREYKQFTVLDPMTGLSSARDNGGNANAWIGSFSIQYSIPYLQNTVKDFGLPEPFAHMIPVAEFNWQSTASSPGRIPDQLDPRSRLYLPPHLVSDRRRSARAIEQGGRHECRLRRASPYLPR